MKKSVAAVVVLGFLLVVAFIDASNPQDDSDLVFDEEILSEAGTSWSSLVANSRVKREPPPSLEERGHGRHRQSVSGGNGSKLAAKGLWTGHHKTKKLHQQEDGGQMKKHRAGHDDTSTMAIKKRVSGRAQPAKKKHTKRNSKAKAIAMKILSDDEDMMLADGSGSGDGPVIPLPPPIGGATPGTRKVYRCSMLIQEPYNEELSNRFSDDFGDMSERFNTAIEQIYQTVPGAQTATVQTFERTSQLSLTKVNFDIESQDFDEEKVIKETLRSAIRNGRVGSFFVESEGFTFRPVTGPSISPIDPEDPELTEDCDVPCQSGGECVRLDQRCDGTEDCRDGSDEYGCQAPSQPGQPAEPLPEELDCRGDIKSKCRGTNNQFYCEEHQCDGIVKCPEGDDEEDCPNLVSSTTPPAPPPTAAPTTPTTTRPAPTTTTTTTTTTPEPEPEPPLPTGCPQDQFSCDGRCLPFSVFCDGRADCLDGGDESDCPVIECQSGEFKCRNNQCISNEQVCDKYADCPDKEDEENCPFGPEPCQAGEFQCKSDKTCIAIAQRCDGRDDCRDGSDEIGCLCTKNQWQCDFGSCIDGKLRCDGKVDCPTDQSDEANCLTEWTTPSNVMPTEAAPTSAPPVDESAGGGAGSSTSDCRSDEFQCDDGSCVGRHFRCDNVPDCSDASDEDNCSLTPPCSWPNPFRCGDGSCIDASTQRCNGVADCADSSDESDCAFLKECPSNEFRCTDGTCIDIRRKCDGYGDCRDRSDEINCTSCLADQFRCSSSGFCIPSNQKCDGIVDCPDRDDEVDCATPPPPVCTEYQFRCRDGTCLDSRRRCDARYDCPDESDEEDCDCRTDQFRCDSGQCIEGNRRCDRTVDCPDRSDESNCGVQCKNGEFSCASGDQCVPYSLVCDGRRDCQDFSDEAECPSRNDELNLKTYPADQTILQGREVVFQCRDEGPARAPVRWTRGSGLALPPSTRDNNGRLEMPNIQPEHTGTYICEAVGYPATTPGARVSVYLKVEPFAEPTTRPPTACGVNEATCMNGECIPKNAVCDGDFDCSDQSDEMRCSLLGCQPNEYQCANKRCVLKNWRCDGDDDCGDNSDELYCKPSPPGSACRHDEFQCQSQNQCIPRSFHCDMELDCQDRSDEIGCSKPTILIPPPPMININIGTTIVINCTAVGVPTPEVVWRLNWGHVPSKCTMTSESGYGVLTCKDAQIIDQGAYSCEAINAKGSTFAVPDCIVVVKPSADICIDEEFNSAAVSPADCLPCFCFDHTKECSSSSLYVSQLPPPSDQFQLITLRTDTIRTSSSARLFSSRDAGSSGAANRVYLRSPNANDGIQAYRRDFNSRSEVAYFNLPPSHRGYQLLSYGGQIKYRLTYRGSGSSIRAPDVILRGNGITLYHESRIRLEPNQPVEVTVRFLPEDWTKGSDARDSARREDLMMVLQSIEYFLIRASYVESSVLDTTITNIRMDTAIEQNYNQGQAVLVEECRCPRGYIGLSCDSCAPGFVREETSSGRYLGRCLPETFCDSTYQWTCASDGTCVDLNRRCDGRLDCGDSSDEMNCSQPRQCDANNEWTCYDGSCIDVRRQCDGRMDCRDRSDEFECLTPTCDPTSQWTCDDRCVDASKRCDGVRDCYDYTDELNCQDADQQRPVAPPAPASPTIVLTVTDPKIQIAEVGSTVRFRCSGQSLVGRQVLLRWGKEGDSLPAGRAQDDRRGVLIITDVRHTDSGTYVCSGQDGINVVTETVVLNVGGQSPSPPLVSVEPRYVEAQLGQSIDVRCTAQGYPTPSIQWLSAREILVPTTDGVLKIASVRKSDEGEYTCTASNPSGTSTGRVNIFVRSEPAPQPEENPVQVVIAPTDTTARRGETIRLVCRAEVVGDRVVPVVRWTRSEGVLPVNAGQTAGVLTIPSASPSDSGIYICTVTTVSGYIRQSQARVTILAYRGPPTVRIEPDRQTISQGTSAELRCLAVGDPSPTVRWTKVGEDFSSNILVTGPILRIVNAMVSDRGMYICTAENAGGVAQTSAIVEVERREPPAVELYPQTKQTVVQGGSALFQCRVTAGIPTPRARWARVDGRPLPNNVEELDGGVIRFNRVTGSEQGQYVCTAENDAGSITGVATLTIQSIPVVTISPNANSGPIRVKEGQRVRLECRAQGDPAPSVSWRRLRTGFLFDAIDAKETQQIAVYDITRVTQSDEGTYSCTGRNDAGLTEERVQIVVEASSGRGDIEENEIEIDGSSNTGGGNIIGDDVFRVPVGGTAEMRCVLTGSQQGIYLDWVRSDGGSLPADKEIRDGILYLRNVQPDAAGVYSCIGISSQGTQIFSADRRLEVVAPPRLRLEPQRQVVRPGDQVEIRCEASGDQPITINWYKMDGVLPPAVLVNNGQLQFRGIAVSDAGRYVCAARNSVGQAEAVAEVIVNEDRVVSGTTGGQRQTDVYIGSTVELSCNLAAGTTGRIQWSRDRGLLPPTAFKTAENKLELTNVQPSDAGRYLCEVTGRQGTSSEYVLLNVKTANATCAHNEFQCKDGQCLKNSTRCNQKIDCKDKSDELNCFIGYKTRKIRGAPTLAVSLTPNKESVRRGDNLEVRCEVTGDPSALVSWRRIGGSLSRNVQVLGNLLRVTDVKPENGGVYRCQVLSTAGTFEENYVLSIQMETRTVSVQSAVMMECRTDLRQPVKYTWSRQGGILPKSARVEGSKLSIPEVRAEDAGTYVCTARNTEETMDLPTVLVVTGVVPYFAQAPLSYMQMPTLPNAYMEFDIEISFKPESPDGLILYNGQQAGGSGDFISFGLNNGYPEFRFDVGAGPAIMKSDKAIDMGKWHTVKLSRNRKNGSMTVDEDGGTFHGSATGRFLGLDLIEPLYIGGVPNIRSIHKLAGFSRGFVGCIGRLVVGSSAHELVRDATNSRGITTCETCALNPCENGGVCQEAYTQQGYTCICPSGFSGLNCDKIGETCYPGACGMGRCVNMAGGFECQCPLGKTGMNCEKEIIIYEPAFTEGSFIAYPTPPKNALRKMRMSMRIKPRQIKDSLLAYCAQTEEGQGDFSSLAIKDKRVEFRFDSGSGPAILRSDREIRAGEWVQITADRSFRDGVLFVNDGSEVRGKSPGSTRGLNLNTRLFVGGWDRQHVRLSPGVNVTSSFDGCLSQFEVQGMELDLVNSVIDSANVEDCGGASACERKPCANGGLCTETGSSLTDYTCQCEEGFSGKSCEIEADLCQVIRPCQNGGSCIGTYNAYKCNCPMGFGGSNCERNVDVAEEAFFQGDSYVEMDKALFPHASSNTAETITVEFSTLEPNGILMWHGQKPETISRGQDFVSLTVVDGRLEFSYELGSGPVQIITPVRVDDGKRHRAVARRTARDGSLELDGVILENGRSPEGPHQILNTKGNIYVGGLPNAEAMTTGRYIHGLKGCIHHLEIQESGVINFQRAALSAINVVPCSSEELKLLMEDDADDDYEPPAN